MNGSINGASISQGGFKTSDITKTRAWGETTDSCPTGAHLGNFYQWQRKISGSWSLVTNPNVEHNPALTCWTVGTYNNSTGGFDVH
ncbi:hypothetical protein FB382_002655 [Nocardioides ginsengisegetis]|uniref:Uncharacterized protein n=1 Tax=Nocardioides ginsengisegetis TaxID=661491 RepID=A0A7W3J1C7_9ACTN|nr:hypothetical protein [Nocardioides ginsengisegetis]MBA8804364.1 hypothetical protein [Nocardioides ginsengisegetis]